MWNKGVPITVEYAKQGRKSLTFEKFREIFHITPFTSALTKQHARLNIYRVSQEECARLQEGVPYVKVYRYNPKHLCPKLNGYGDNGQRKVWFSGGSTHCTCQLTSLIDVCSWVWCPIRKVSSHQPYTRMRSQPCYLSACHSCVMYSAWNPKDNYDMRASFFVVQFNGFMSLTSQFDVKYRY